MEKARKVITVILVCLILATISIPAFASTAFEEGPTSWLIGNGTSDIGDHIVATATGNSLYVGGSASFKTTGSVASRVITVEVALFDVDTGYRLGFATKSERVAYDGVMPATDYYNFKSSSKISYSKGQECKYKVTRTNFTTAIQGRYKGYLST